MDDRDTSSNENVKKCCQWPHNLEEETDPKLGTYQRCKVCKCRHFTMNAPPIEFGVTGSEISG